MYRHASSCVHTRALPSPHITETPSWDEGLKGQGASSSAEQWPLSSSLPPHTQGLFLPQAQPGKLGPSSGPSTHPLPQVTEHSFKHGAGTSGGGGRASQGGPLHTCRGASVSPHWRPPSESMSQTGLYLMLSLWPLPCSQEGILPWGVKEELPLASESL